MTDNKDIYRSAQMLIQQHGGKAEDFAHQKLLEMMGKNDMKNACIWLSIGQAVDNLQTLEWQGKLH